MEENEYLERMRRTLADIEKFKAGVLLEPDTDPMIVDYMGDLSRLTKKAELAEEFNARVEDGKARRVSIDPTYPQVKVRPPNERDPFTHPATFSEFTDTWYASTVTDPRTNDAPITYRTRARSALEYHIIKHDTRDAIDRLYKPDNENAFIYEVVRAEQRNPLGNMIYESLHKFTRLKHAQEYIWNHYVDSDEKYDQSDLPTSKTIPESYGAF